VLAAIKKLLAPNQILFVGVTDPINPRIETAEEVRDRVLEAAEIIPVESLGTTDDRGFPRSRTIRRLPGKPRLPRCEAGSKERAWLPTF
jgi:methionine synthase II (cobalamin-independent)